MTTLTAPRKAETSIFQRIDGDWEEEFRCGWDFSGPCDEESTINHLSEILEANEAGEEVFEDGNGLEFDLHGMTPRQFATFIVKYEEKAKQKYRTNWEIYTKTNYDSEEEFRFC